MPTLHDLHWRSLLWWLVLTLGTCNAAWSQGAQIWRCGHEYTNTPPAAARACVPITQAAVTVIEGTRVQAGASEPSATALASTVRVDPSQQRQRDQDALAVLQAELDRARQQQQRLQRERPVPDASRDPTASNERLQPWREAVQRNEADIAGLQREIARLSGGKP